MLRVGRKKQSYLKGFENPSLFQPAYVPPKPVYEKPVAPIIFKEIKISKEEANILRYRNIKAKESIVQKNPFSNHINYGNRDAIDTANSKINFTEQKPDQNKRFESKFDPKEQYPVELANSTFLQERANDYKTNLENDEDYIYDVNETLKIAQEDSLRERDENPENFQQFNDDDPIRNFLNSITSNFFDRNGHYPDEENFRKLLISHKKEYYKARDTFFKEFRNRERPHPLYENLEDERNASFNDTFYSIPEGEEEGGAFVGYSGGRLFNPSTPQTITNIQPNTTGKPVFSNSLKKKIEVRKREKLISSIQREVNSPQFRNSQSREELISTVQREVNTPQFRQTRRRESLISSVKKAVSSPEFLETQQTGRVFTAQKTYGIQTRSKTLAQEGQRNLSQDFA